MFLEKLLIQNFRGFKSITVEFSQGINLLIGNNGSGKTSLIEALSIALGTSFSLVHGVPNTNMKDDTVRYVYEKNGDATHSFKRKFPQEVSCIFQWDTKTKYSIGMKRVGEVKTAETVDYGLSKKLSEILNKNEMSPIFCLQNFDRDWNLCKENQNVSMSTGMTLRIDGYRNCLSGIGIEDVIQSWCLKMSFLEFQKKQPVHEFQLFQDTVKKFMSIMMETSDDDIKIEYSIETQGMEITIGEHKDSIYNLSTGYRAILSMIMELAYRAAVLNPTMEDFSELEGVVLIDEIDAHLHPKWQWKILDAMRQVFPCVQFIIATHSPIVISSIKDARIIKIIDLKTTEVLEPAYGYTADEVLELRQGSTSRPENIVERKRQLELAVDDGDFARADEIVQSVKEEFGETSPVYDEMNRFLRVNRWVEEL